jgi:amino acid adenylation domain-containing protein
LSFGQQRLWVLHELFPGSYSYNVPVAFRLTGDLDIPALRAALSGMVARHEVLRSRYHAGEDGAPVQLISPPAPVPLPVTEIAGAPGTRPAAARRLAGRRAKTPFDLAAAPPLRAELLRLGPRDHVLLLVIHHIAADHWSLSVLADEISARYPAELGRPAGTSAAGQPAAEPAAEPGELPQYADYAARQRARLAAGEYGRHLAYWRHQLDGVAAQPVPGDRPRPAVPSPAGRRASVTLPAELCAQLRRVYLAARVSLFMTMLAALQVLLARYTGSTDVTVGNAVADRSDPEFENLIGFFVNTVVLRADLSGDPTFTELLNRARDSVFAGHEHQDLPFEKIVEVLAPDRDLSQAPLFTVAMSYLGSAARLPRLPGVTVTEFAFPAGLVRFDLDVFVTEAAGSVTVAVDYRSDLFDRRTIEGLLGHYVHVLGAAARAPGTPVSRLALAGPAQARRVAGLGTAPASHPVAPLVPELIAGHGRRAPAAPAVRHGDAVVSYAELDERAGRLARRLRRLGIGPDQLVGVCADRSPELIVAMLGVLKADGAYLPLDPDYPAARLAYMVRDSRVRVIVATGPAADRLPPGPARVLRLDAGTGADEGDGAADGTSMGPAAGPANLAYAIYTSGSTGQPKGVLIEHASLLNLCHWHAGRYRPGPGDRVTMVAAQSFDASVWEVWPALAAGACVCVADARTRSDPALLAAWLRAQDAALTFLPTPMAELLLAAPDAGTLPVRALLTGGDVLTRRPSAGLPYPVVNHYGPTECTVVATAGTVTPAKGSGSATAGRARPPGIGGPVDNARVRVLDAAMAPVPVGVPGELYIGGAVLARGYLHRPGLTAERFTCDPAGPPGSRLYRTGDRARWRADGTLEFLGRADRQVKLRGHRIEPAEIEARLAEHPAIAEAAVTVRAGAGGRRLVAYVVPGPPGRPAPQPAQVRAWLRDQLPDYLVPETVTLLSRLPVTPSGKLDYAALPEPAAAKAGPGAPPRTDTERRVAALFDEVLGRAGTGRDDDFFDLGGHSMLAATLIGRVRQDLGVRLSLRSVFRSPTVAGLSAAIAGQGPRPAPDQVSRDLLSRLSALPADQALALLGGAAAASGAGERAEP